VDKDVTPAAILYCPLQLAVVLLQLYSFRTQLLADSCLQCRLLLSVCYPQGLVAGGLEAAASILCLNLGLHYLQGPVQTSKQEQN
jgi:hypothetical protein